MIGDFSGETVLITGAGSGIGREAARLFAEHGADVVVNDVDGGAAESAADLVDEAAPSAETLAVEADVVDADDVERMVDAALDRFGAVDVLFNNAGISHASSPIDEVTEETWDRVMDVNVKSAFLVTKHLVPHLRERGGAIVNNASVTSHHPRSGTSAYAASNGAMFTLTRELAIELAEYGVRANAVSATATDTPLLRELMSEREESGYVTEQRIVDSIPLGRMVEPEEVAHAALFLASDAAAMITGEELVIDGGRSI